MARLRFPGRPGHRFDRISVRYFDDDAKNISDPAIAFLPQFKRGLQLFRELVGESDEDEEFEGFSVDDLHCAEKKLKQHEHEKKKSLESPEKTSPPSKPTLGTRLKSATSLLDNLPAAERTRGRKKVLVRKSYQEIVKEGLVSPTKTHEILKSKDVVSPEGKIKEKKPKVQKIRPTTFKLDEKYNVPGSHVKRSDNKDMAKFLLEKAKQAQKIAQQKRDQKSVKKTPVSKREFVLPTQSSRSSRVIKPNKRFLEDDSVHSVVKKKSKPEQDSDHDNESLAKVIKNSKISVDKPTGLLDQPLIVDGKRERKLSLKMKQKSSDFGMWENYEDFPDVHQTSPSFKPVKNVFSPPHLVVCSPLAAPKLGSSLFSQTGTQFQKASEQQRLGMMGLTHSRKPGAAIVQKAKLQLNRDALNKSKAALAKSLKAKMKKEAKIGEMGHPETQQVKGENTLSVSQLPMADGTPHLPLEAKKRKKIKQCAVCHTRINLVTRGTGLACSACCKFLWNIKKYIGVKEFVCVGKGKCVFNPANKTACRACRVKKCLEGGLIKGESLTRLTALFYQKYKVNGAEKTKGNHDSVFSVQPKGASTPKHSGLHTFPSKSPPLLPVPSLNIPSKDPPVAPEPVIDRLKSPIDKSSKLKPVISVQSETSKISEVESEPINIGETKDDQDADEPIKVRTLSGEIREHKKKKQKAFKELLKTKQERTENLLAIPDTPRTIPGQTSVDTPRTSPHSPGKGPRIKHVCRNAAMVLGKTPATFPPVSEIRLSALPTKEKVQLWKKEEAVKAAMGESDDERPIEEIIQHSSDNVCILKKSPAYSSGKEKKKPHFSGVKGFKHYKRKIRCKKCAGCLASCCGKCTFCRDMRKFGGPGLMKQACIKRKCHNPKIGKPATEAFLDLKTDDHSDSESNAGSAASSPRKPRSGPAKDGIKEAQLDNDDLPGSDTFSEVPLNSRSEVRRLDFGSVPSIMDSSLSDQSHRLSTRIKSGKINSKRIKIDIQEKYAKKIDNTDGQFYPVSLQSVVPASKYWGASLKTPENHPIKVDFMGVLTLSALWKQGLALTLAGSICVRTVCFLCGSAGKHELFYCNICCEPFHEFCLEEDIPDASHLDDWVCPRCQFCHVCGRQNNLLRCDKCHDMYHPECLGPNYPTKPSRKKGIWICTKCVKCKSCGATTPGSASYATWTYDFSLCYECGQLMDKGNFCPICRKCYSDDDWESKMVQCSMCESWVHAKCEGLSDEMYEILSYMPEDMSFNCRKCFPVGCPEWELTLKRELRNGLENILQTLIMSKSSQYVYKYEKKKSPKKLCGETTNVPENIDNKKVENLDMESSTDQRMNEKPLVEGNVKSDTSESNFNLLTSDMSGHGSGDLLKGKSQNILSGMPKSTTRDVVGENLQLSQNADSDSPLGLECCDKVKSSDEKNSVNQVSDFLKTGSESMEMSCKDQVVGNTMAVVTNSTKDGHSKEVPNQQGNTLEDSCNDSKSLTENCTNSADSEAKTRTGQNDVCVQTSGIVEKSIERTAKDQVNRTCVLPEKEKSVRVHFSDAVVKKIEPEHPKDLLEIQKKMKEGFYSSVALFCEDIMRIIQEYLDDEEETRCTRKKAINTARSVFVKQMEKVFPWYNIKTCRYWYGNKNFPRGMLPDATLPPTSDHTYAQWLEREQLPLSPQPSPFKKYTATPVKKLRSLDDEDGDGQTQLEGEDTRKCLLCLKFGDQDSNAAGRLLYCGQDDWIHVNCALWSAEVYEDTDGSLQNLKEAYSRGKMLKCNYCQLSGATVGCNTRGCIANYHFMCAREDKCVFQVDKKIFCNEHRSHTDNEILSENKFSVLRRVFVKSMYVRTVKKSWANGLNSAEVNVVIGSCTVECLGKLTYLSDRPRFLVPVNYMCTRVYWSTKDARRRCVYTCSVREVHPETLKSPTVPIKDMRIVHDEADPDFVPLTQLNLSEMGIEIMKTTETVKKSESEADDFNVSHVVDLTGDLEETSRVSMDTSEETLSHVGPLSSSFGGRDSKKLFEPASLSESWPGVKGPEKEKLGTYSIDLTVLSPTTQKLLSMTDLKKYKTAEPKPSSQDEDLGLIKIADRLNRAAAKSRQSSEERSLDPRPPSVRRSRSSSLEAQSVPRPFSPTSPNSERSIAPRPFSPPFRMSNQSLSRSGDKVGSPVLFSSSVSISVVTGTRATSVDRMVPARPFSPPLRLPHRARSASLEKTCFAKSLLSSDTIAKLSEKRKDTPTLETVAVPSSGMSSTTSMCISSQKTPLSKTISSGRSTDPDEIQLSGVMVSPDPKPIRASSPLEQKFKHTSVNETKDDSDCNISQSSTVELSDSESESSKEENKSMEMTKGSILKAAKETGNVETNVPANIIDDTEVKMVEDNNVAQNGAETVVIMTDSAEEISEEEAILIAEAAIEQASGDGSHVLTRTDSDIMQDKEESAVDESENILNEKDKTEDLENDAELVGIDDDTRKESTSQREIIEIEENETAVSSDSPFIPKLVRYPDDQVIMPELNYVSDLRENKEKLDSSDLQVKDGVTLQKRGTLLVPEIISSDSEESDSEIMDITVSIIQAANSVKTSDPNTVPGDDLAADTAAKGAKIIDSDIEILDNLGSGGIPVSESVRKDDASFSDKGSKGVKNIDSMSGEKDKIEKETVIDKYVNLPEKSASLNELEGENVNSSNIKPVAEVESIGFSELNKCENIDHADIVKDNSYRAKVTDAMKNTDHEVDDEMNKPEFEKQNSVNTIDEIDGHSALISSLTSFADGLVNSDNSEKLHLIPISRSESNDAIHVGIIEDTDSDSDSSSLAVVTITPEKEGSSNSMDKNIFERMKQFSLTTDTEITKDERSEAEKHEVMRGLGLERSEEVEKAKKSPKSSPVPLKTYPLRKNMMSPARYRDTDNMLGLCRKEKENQSHEEKDCHSSLPVLDPIAKKIKLESLAKSSTDARGPFRCDTCKRSYRTETSLQLHREKCDFEVSTSDEEDDNDDQDNQSNSRRASRKKHEAGSEVSSGSTRSSLRKSTMVQRVALEVEKRRMQEEETTPKKRGRPSLMASPQNVTGKTNFSPVISRFSQRSLQKSLKSNSISPVRDTSRGRGRPRKLGTISPKILSPEKRKPGRPRKYGQVENMPKNVKTTAKTLKSREKLSAQKYQSTVFMKAKYKLRQKLLMKESAKNASLGVRGRPRKDINTDMPVLKKTGDVDGICSDIASNLKEDIPVNQSCQESSQKYELRHTRRSERFDEMPVLEKSYTYLGDSKGSLNSNSETESPPLLTKSVEDKEDNDTSYPACKRGRGRPPKHTINNSADSPKTDKKTTDDDKSSSSTCKKRDLPSLREEVESCRKFKRLKRDSSQEKSDVIEINSSDEEIDENTSRGDNKSKESDEVKKNTSGGNTKSQKVDQSDVINKDTSMTDRYNKQTAGNKENDSEKTGESEQKESPSLVSKTDDNQQHKHIETDFKMYCDDSVLTNVHEEEHSGNGQQNTKGDNGSTMENIQNHTNGTGHVAHQNTTEKSVFMNSLQFPHPLKKTNPTNVGKEDSKKNTVITKPDLQDKNINSLDNATNIMKKKKGTAEEDNDEKIIVGNSDVPGSEKSSLSASRSGQLKGGQGGEESNPVASNSSLSNTVLKLLKEGHKVLIKNPKLGKSFLWEKTEKGYVGRPYEKEVKIQHSAATPSHTTSTVTLSSYSTSTVTSNSATSDSSTRANRDNSERENSMTKLKPYSKPVSTTSSLQELEKINARISEGSGKVNKNQEISEKTGNFPEQFLDSCNLTTVKANVPIKVSSSLTKGAKQQQTVCSETKIKNSTVSQILMNYLAGKKDLKQQKTASSASKVISSESNLSCTSNPRLSVEYLGTIHSSTRSITVVTQVPTLLTPSTRSTIPTTFPGQNISLSNVQPPNAAQPQIQTEEAGVQGFPVPNLLSPLFGTNVSQVPLGSAVTSQSVNLLMTNQPQNLQQNQYLSQLAVSNSLTVQVSSSPQHPVSNPIILQQVPYINQLPVIVPLGPQVGSSSISQVHSSPTVFQPPMVQNSPSLFQPVLQNILSTSPNVCVSPSIASSTVVNMTNNQTSSFSPKNNESVAKDVADIVRNLQKHSNVQFPFQSSSVSTGGSVCPFSDALRQTAEHNQGIKLDQQKELAHQFTDILKTQPDGGKSFFRKVKQVLGKKTLTPKSTLFHHKKLPGHKPVYGIKEIRFVSHAPERQIKAGHMMPKSLSVPEKSVFKHRPYSRRVGNVSPMKKRGRPKGSKRKSPLKTRKIEGPHSLSGYSSHPIIHGPKETSSLPAAALEEEVVDTPLDAMYDQLDPRQQGTSKKKENRGHLQFEITSDDGFSCKSDTIDGAWRQVIDRVQDARAANRLKQLSYGGLNGLSLSGLSHNNTVYLVEQLYGAGYCQTYKFRYHSHDLRRHEEPPENPSGCIRTEPFDGRKPYDMFSFLMSRYRARPEMSASTEDIEMMQKSSRRATSMDLPMAMRFRKLKEHSREAVGVYRSRIHGRGLYCKRTIDAGEMIIEYSGEVIRTSLTDVREKYYESKGIGCYMFRIDDTDVVDATMKGSAARFINHSCEPNCYSKVINVDNRKHIVIFAMRQIQRGEELTYDYKFPIEDVKILCTCGSRRCRKYLN